MRIGVFALLCASTSAFTHSRILTRHSTRPTLNAASSQSYEILEGTPLLRTVDGFSSPITSEWASDDDQNVEAAVVVFFRSFG
jgi:hypothetical protein